MADENGKWKYQVGDVVVVEYRELRATVTRAFERDGRPWYGLKEAEGIGGEYAEDKLTPATPRIGDWVERDAGENAPVHQGKIDGETANCWILSTGKYADKEFTRVVARSEPEPAAEPVPEYVPQFGDIVRHREAGDSRYVVLSAKVTDGKVPIMWEFANGSPVAPTTVANLTLLSRHGCDGCERVAKAEKRVAELEAQVGKPLTLGQAQEIERLAEDYADARCSCTPGRPCTCHDTSIALRTYLRSLTRPSSTPEVAPVPDSIEGCREELGRLGAEAAQLPTGMSFAPLKVRINHGCSTSIAEFGEAGMADTITDWQAAVRWARGVKQEVQNG